MPDLFSRIDWQQLRSQKAHLTQLICKFGDEDEDVLWGLVHMIDAIQDMAVDGEYATANEVFGQE